MSSSRRSGRPQDAYGRKAKREGFPARSVYKLEEIDRRARLFSPGQRVLDLGAFPGSWSLYAAQRVGPRGHVLGIDLQAYRGALPPNVEMRQADILAFDYEGELGGRTFNVVLSDMAPATSGHKSLDQARSFNLFMEALDIATRVLEPGGSFVGKIFQGGDFEQARAAVRAAFEADRIIRPKATRTESVETFVVGLRRRAPIAEDR